LNRAAQANIAVKTKSHNRFKRISKYLPKHSTYGMIINFQVSSGFIRPILVFF